MPSSSHRTLLRAALIASLLPAVSACGHHKPPAAPTPQVGTTDWLGRPLTLPAAHEDSRWVRYTNSDTVVVFLHGINATTASTWLFEDEKAGRSAYWPVIVARDSAFGNAAVFVAGYPADNRRVKTADLSTSVDAVFDAIARRDVSQPRSVLDRPQVIVVAHSLGGIVMRELLRAKASRLPDHDFALVLMSSPSSGSWVATAADNLVRPIHDRLFGSDARTKLLQWLRSGDRNLTNLNEWTVEQIKGGDDPRIVGKVACETAPLAPFIQPTTPQSCLDFFGTGVAMKGRTHSTIVRPRDERDEPHAMLRSYLEGTYRTDADTSRNVGQRLDVTVSAELHSARAYVQRDSVVVDTLVGTCDTAFTFARTVTPPAVSGVSAWGNVAVGEVSATFSDGVDSISVLTRKATTHAAVTPVDSAFTLFDQVRVSGASDPGCGAGTRRLRVAIPWTRHGVVAQAKLAEAVLPVVRVTPLQPEAVTVAFPSLQPAQSQCDVADATVDLRIMNALCHSQTFTYRIQARGRVGTQPIDRSDEAQAAASALRLVLDPRPDGSLQILSRELWSTRHGAPPARPTEARGAGGAFP